MLDPIIEKRLAQLEQRIAELQKENAELKHIVGEQQKMLALLLSPHIPSSKRILKEAKKEETPPMKKGAPEGHKGATRIRPKPDQTIFLNPVSCPNKKCKSKKISVLKKHKKTVEDIKIVKTATRFYYFVCTCNDCGKEFTTASKDLPRQGNFGPNIISAWSTLHYIGTIPFDRLSKISENLFGVNITPAGVHNAIYKTSGIFEKEFQEIKTNITKSNYVRSDETGYSVNGKNWFLWNLSSLEDVLVLIRPSRGSKVLKEVFGDFLDAILNSDCFSSYSKFKAREYQKCWAHILDDAEDLAKNSYEGIELDKILSRMFAYIKKIKEEGSENSPKVKKWIKTSVKKIDFLAKKKLNSKAVANLILRLEKYKEQWFTCLKYPYVEPTNNASEQYIRKNVLARKISGLHRSPLGIHSREIMMSKILTCQTRKENPYETLRTGIENYNLGHTTN